jgi:hypothetical protein
MEDNRHPFEFVPSGVKKRKSKATMIMMIMTSRHPFPFFKQQQHDATLHCLLATIGRWSLRTRPSSQDASLPTPSGINEQFAYLARIGELEATLQHQQPSQYSNQYKMQQRVVELEQALKFTATTPRGTNAIKPWQGH